MCRTIRHPCRDRGVAVRVVIGEDLFLLRDGLVRLLEAHAFEVVAAVGSAPELLKALTELKPDVGIVDVRLPPSFTDDGLRVAIEARRACPGLPLLVLSQYVEQLYARELLADQAGGVGYLLKDRVFSDAAFADAVRDVAGGGTVLDPGGCRRAHDKAREIGSARRADPARARGPVPDGPGPLQRRDRREAVHHREGGKQARRRHLRQPGPGAVRR